MLNHLAFTRALESYVCKDGEREKMGWLNTRMDGSDDGNDDWAILS